MSQQPSILTAIRADFNNAAFLAQIKAALPEHVTVERFQRVALTAISGSTILAKCNRVTLLKSCMEAAADGLLPDGREGAIVPFRTKDGGWEAQWMPMVWGLVKLVRNSGELKDIGVEIVRSNDKFERWIDENGPHFRHTPSLDGSGDPIGVYAYARTKDGGFYIEYMAWREIEKFRSLSKAKSSESPWNAWPDEMAKVRPIKRLCKRLPMSTDVQHVFERDDRREAVLMAGEQVNPIESMNRQITGAGSEPPPAPPAPPALTDESSVSFDEIDIMIVDARDLETLKELQPLIAAVPDREQREELIGRAQVRELELKG